MVFLGDYIDRGPDSKGVIEYLMEFQQRFPNSVFLRGNHEQMLLDAMLVATTAVSALPEHDLKEMLQRCFWTAGCQYLKSDDLAPGDECLENCRACKQVASIFFSNGGDTTLLSYDPNPPVARKPVGLGRYGVDPGQPRWWYTDFRTDLIPEEHRSFLQATRLMHLEQQDGQQYLFVHAGYNPDYPLLCQPDHNLLWMRDIAIDQLPDDLIVIHGHTPSKWVACQYLGADMYHWQEIKLDSGVCYPDQDGLGKLSCCNVLTRDFWQA